MKKTLALLMVMVMLFDLSACGQSAAPAATETPAEAEAPVAEATAAEEPAEDEDADYIMVKADLDGEAIGTLCVPADWDYELTTLVPEDTPLPTMAAMVSTPVLYMVLNRVGPDAYEVSGVPMPADVEEYSQRAGMRAILQEGEEYTYDEMGNLCVVREIDLEGTPYIWAMCLKQGTNAMGGLVLQYPADMELDLPYIFANSNLA